ncbi:hypothetical protein D3C71_1624070 [compost metagenome]
MVAVQAVTVETVQVHVVKAGAGVDHAVVDDAALQVQHAKQLAGLHRYAMDDDVQPMVLALGLVPGGVTRLAPGAQQAAAGTEPVDHDGDFQPWPRGLGLVQGIQHFLAGLVFLQVQRNDDDTPGCGADALEQAGAVGLGIGQHLYRLGRHGVAWQCRQHGFGVH